MRISDWSSDVCSSDLHPWMPTMPPPYVIANVALEEDASVRLTTNVVGCEPDDVRLGQEVAVRFEQQGDVFLPLFEPPGGPDDPDPVPEPKLPTPRAPPRDDPSEHRSALSRPRRAGHGHRPMVPPHPLPGAPRDRAGG